LVRVLLVREITVARETPPTHLVAVAVGRVLLVLPQLTAMLVVLVVPDLLLTSRALARR
jgi:hypothetical protein